MRTGSSSALTSNPAPVLFLIAAVAVLFWPDAAVLTTLTACLVLVVSALLIWVWVSRDAAIIGLITASAVPRLFVEIGGLKAHPEHMLSGAMIVAIPFVWKKREQPLQWTRAEYFLMAYIGLNLFASLFMSIAPSQTSKWALQQVLAILPYFWLRILVSDRERFRWAFRVLLVVGALVSLYALVCFYSYRFLGTDFGMDLSGYGYVPAAYGLQYEENLLGAYSGALCVMMLAMYLGVRRRIYLWGSTCVAMLAMVISLSRGALGATVIGLLVLSVYAFRQRMLERKVVRSVVIAMLCAAAIGVPSVFGYYMERFSTIEIADPTSDPNTLTRAVQAVTALDEIAAHPIFGGGTASFQLEFDWQALGADWEDQGWIGNTELRVLHDTGVVGLLAFAAFLGSLVLSAWKVLKKERSPELVALLVSAVVYTITFQATEGTLLAFSWVHLGLIACGVAVMSQDRKNQISAGEIPA